MSVTSIPPSSILPATRGAFEPAHPPIIIQTELLRKVYRTGFWLKAAPPSLKHCSLDIYRGETFGLLGPNGAGKTTLLKLLLGIIRPSAGGATLMGQPAGHRQTKAKIGYLPENPYFYDYLTGWEFLSYTAGLFGIKGNVQKRRIVQLLDLVQLDIHSAKKKQMRRYSKGMLQRVGMAQALMNDPEIIFLDEPMSGLDPTGRYQVREIILSLKQQGKTLFFNSHVLSDVERICDRIAILDQGEIVCIGAIKELLGNPDYYKVQGRGGSLDVLRRWLKNISFQNGCWYGTMHGDPFEFMSTARQMNAQITQLAVAKPTLEEFFIEQIQQSRTITAIEQERLARSKAKKQPGRGKAIAQ
ncbi:ABC transporter, ATP-binding protein [Synechococcus sp. PCC 7335]|uniref:ABC transporter ATP-binding protein n=1 Tax=Synechococcus sp. (strain ATCC 29403 / PCC 7335) TaxID=91464 RepID=UPI00017EDC7D|nr:ABC transporter ATP-binding protein [Synechococcus sp. PCC 7335]EDX84509.1 ABC transporter, ATP-binding protein [Synechococcus sp. PCC 7335]